MCRKTSFKNREIIHLVHGYLYQFYCILTLNSTTSTAKKFATHFPISDSTCEWSHVAFIGDKTKKHLYSQIINFLLNIF